MKKDTVETGAPTKESMAQLETISAFRFQMLAAQLHMDMTEGFVDNKSNRRKPSTVRSINRIFWTAINQLSPTGVETNPPVNDSEKRAASTMIELLNGLMLQITLKEASKKVVDAQETKGEMNG